jgi:LPS-assembly lipoprotein
MKYPKCLTFLCLLLVMTGCGFQLRGQFAIPACFKTLKVQPENAFTPFQQALKKTLHANGVTVIEAQDEESTNLATLLIINQTLTERTIAYGADIQASRGRMQLEVIYQLKDATGALVIDNSKIKVEREFQINPNAVLGTENEREHVRSEIYLEGAAQLIRQLSVTLSKDLG